MPLDPTGDETHPRRPAHRQHARRGEWPASLAAAGRAEALRKDSLDARLMRIEASMRVAADKAPTERKQALSAVEAELAEIQQARADSPQVRSLRAHVLVLRGLTQFL